MGKRLASRTHFEEYKNGRNQGKIKETVGFLLHINSYGAWRPQLFKWRDLPMYEDHDGHGLTDMGWEIHPHGMGRVLQEASRFGIPIIITENGIATRDGQKKIKFIKRHVDMLEKCLKKGMDIRGSFYWSLMDNYEWLKGLDAKFGLYSVDYNTLARKPTPAASFYSYLIKSRSQF